MKNSQGLTGKLKYTSWVKTFKIQAFNPRTKQAMLIFLFHFSKAIDGAEETFIMMLP